MPIVKLDAIGSTNDFLSEMVASQSVENYTVVSAESQTKGRGQQGASWYSEPGKNLTVSVYIESVFSIPDAIFTLNAAVALAVADTLQTFKVQQVAIKWPNDILSGGSKVSGILIENTWRGDRVASIVGIGLNVNQTDFAGMPNVSSMALLKNRQFDRDAVLDILLTNLEEWTFESEKRSEGIWSAYHKLLFKRDVPAVFETTHGLTMGIIRGVTHDGRLRVEHEDGTEKLFAVREVKMRY